MLNTKKLKKYARKYRAMKACDKMTKRLRKELDTEAPGLIDHMISEEIDKMSLKGGDILGIKKEIWPKILAKDEDGNSDKAVVVAALRKAGLHEIVTEQTYQNQRLAAYLRELDKGEQPLPEALVGVLRANEVPKLVVKTFK